ncbi:uncharacterized protein PHACADRAFT_252049 [Phanerochaete carnosa HHB-10118-sp]|uniref:DUF6593 domain-containing protein n=1 Tax=Phanerochaete carnosa (strain HHB-10118-sp) TaxID=650164 RepID=K5V5U3_PHACS|nr:uncharacterized protein PHACADRAFT_252049 [Phanerochaete carnosa HHB-10118-sp]EKM58061.1 hypothetical protein PHACADRAFT_252049 [Phanerochaete carnosa HHB-10118-sp]
MIVPEEDITLTLTPDNVSNTALVSETGRRLYTVSTEHGKATTTSVRNTRDEVIASLEWRNVFPDKVTIGSKEPILMTEWMKRSIIPFKDDLTFTDGEGRKYKWKGNSAGRSFELCCADDNYLSIIARFQRSRRVTSPSSLTAEPNASTPSLAPTPVNPTWTPAVLVLTPRAQQIQDTVVVSFLFLEKTRRINETEHQTRADVLGTAVLKPVGKSAMVVVNGGV